MYAKLRVGQATETNNAKTESVHTAHTNTTILKSEGINPFALIKDNGLCWEATHYPTRLSVK